MSKILDILNAPWAIEPSKFEQIVAIYDSHLRGEKIDLQAVEAQLGRPLANEPQGYTVYDGVAVLPLHGVISRRMNFFSKISGGISTELMTRDLRAALTDNSAHSIIQYVDSPGGSISGIQQYAGLVYESRSIKPIVTLGDGQMSSAAMWVGAAASQRYVADETTIVGSLGVITKHVDISKAEEKQGIKTTPIYSGKYKGIATEFAPLTAEGEAHIKALTDHIYSVMVNDLAKFYGISQEKVLEQMAEAQLFLGRKAIDSGLVSDVMTLDRLIEKLNAESSPVRFGFAAGAVATKPAIAAIADAGVAAQDTKSTSYTKGNEMITREFLLANHSELVEAFRAEGFTRGDAEGRAAGATAERERIQAVEAQALPGHEKLIGALKFDGKTTGPEAAVQVLAAERTVASGRAAALANDGAALTVVATASQLAAGAPTAADDESLPLEERCKAKWDKDAKLRAEFNGSFTSFLAYEQAAAKGVARILKTA